MDSGLATVLGALSGLLSATLGALLARRQRKSLDRDVDVERRRLSDAVIREGGIANTGYIEGGVYFPAPQDDDESGPPTRSDDHQDRFAVLLVDYYAHGLVQAKRSFAASLYCSVLGGLVLITGVGMAIFRASSDGGQIASVTTTVAGVLTTSVSALFGRQAASALRHMEGQTKLLRQDMKAERDLHEAVEPELVTFRRHYLCARRSGMTASNSATVLKRSQPSTAHL